MQYQQTAAQIFSSSWETPHFIPSTLPYKLVQILQYDFSVLDKSKSNPTTDIKNDYINRIKYVDIATLLMVSFAYDCFIRS